MSIARDRARVMAANDVMSHTEPDGTKVFDRINAAGITWYAAGEIIAWNHYPAEYSTAEAIRAWWASPGHHAIMVSTGYNYVGFGAAVSADGKLYYAGVFAKVPDHTGAVGEVRDVSMRTVDAHPQAGHGPLDGRRHAPPGPDLRPALLPGPLAAAGWRVALRGRRPRRPTGRSRGHRGVTVRGPGPVAGPGRQLVDLADDQRSSLTRATAGAIPDRPPEANLDS